MLRSLRLVMLPCKNDGIPQEAIPISADFSKIVRRDFSSSRRIWAAKVTALTEPPIMTICIFISPLFGQYIVINVDNLRV